MMTVEHVAVRFDSKVHESKFSCLQKVIRQRCHRGDEKLFKLSCFRVAKLSVWFVEIGSIWWQAWK